MTTTGGGTAGCFRLGVNYWPARTAMRWWSDFDPGEVGADFDRLSSAGFDSVRIFLTWEDFQPTPDAASTEALDRLVVVADLAKEAGLDLMPTFFTGHMSGVNWIPGWALASTTSMASSRFRVVSGGSVLDRDLRSWFTDPGLVDAQALLVGKVAAALAGHSGLWAWDLGNENSNCAVPPDRTAGLAWLERMTTAIRQADAASAITIGLHMEDLEQDRNLGPAEAATVCDFLTMHGYPIYARWAAGPTDEHLLGFLTEVTRWLGGGADVLFSEFGLPTSPEGHAASEASESMLVEERVAADYTDRSLTQLRRAGATGAMLWCANDYVSDIWDTPPLDEAAHERSFGLWRADGSPKPSVERIESHRSLEIVTAPTDLGWIDIEPAEFYEGGSSQLARLYRRYSGRVLSET